MTRAFQFQNLRATDDFFVGAAIGSGGAARAAEVGGADFVIALTAGRFRVRGVPSIACMLPLGDANALALGLVEHEIAPLCEKPIFIGLSAMNSLDDLEDLVSQALLLGCSGVMNFPTVAHFSAEVADSLERAGIGFGRELSLLRAAQEQGLETIAHVTNVAQAVRAASAGVSAVCLNYGWNSGGETGARASITLAEAAVIAAEVRRSIRKINPNVRLLLEGGPIETAADLVTVLEASRADGYVGGSTFDRLPLETGLANQVQDFKNSMVTLGRRTREKSRRLKVFADVGLFGHSRAMVELAEQAEALARGGGPVLVVGEEGTGKQRLAEAIARVRRHSVAVIANLNTAMMNPTQIQNRLFGVADDPYGQGILSGPAPFVLLRDLAELPKVLQRRLAKYIETGDFTMAGTRRRFVSSVEIYFQSHHSLTDLKARNLIDARLAELLTRAEIRVPPLRERPEDVDEVLAQAMQAISRTGALPGMSPLARRRLRMHSWPGNLTEVISVAGELMTRSNGQPLGEADVVACLVARRKSRGDAILSEREIILDALWRHGFNRTITASFLGISRKTLFNRIRKYQLTGPGREG